MNFTSSQIYMLCMSALLIHSLVFSIPYILAILAGIVIFLLLPGHLAIGLFMPDFLNSTEKVHSSTFLAVPATSISIVSLSAFALASFGILNKEVIMILFTISSILAFYSPGVEINFTTPAFGEFRSLLYEIFLDKENYSVFSAILIASLILGSSTLLYEYNNSEEPWIEFYVTDDEGNIDSISRTWSSSEPMEITLELVNHGVGGELSLFKTVEFIDDSDKSTIISQNTLLVKSDFSDGKTKILENLSFSNHGDYIIYYDVVKSGELQSYRSLTLRVNYSG